MEPTIVVAIISSACTVLGYFITPIIAAKLSEKKIKEDRMIAEAKANKEQAERDKHQDEMFQMLIGGQVKQLCQYAIKEGEISLEDLEHIHSLYRAYKELKGNGFIDSLLKKINKLPIV